MGQTMDYKIVDSRQHGGNRLRSSSFLINWIWMFRRVKPPYGVLLEPRCNRVFSGIVFDEFDNVCSQYFVLFRVIKTS